MSNIFFPSFFFFHLLVFITFNRNPRQEHIQHLLFCFYLQLLSLSISGISLLFDIYQHISQNFIFYSNLYSIVLDYQIYFMNITNICICIACITSLIIKKKIGPGTNFAQVWAPAAPTWDIQSTYILCPYPFPHSSYLASNFSVCLISSCVGSAPFFFCCLPLFLYWVTAFSPRSLEFIYNIMNKAVN